MKKISWFGITLLICSNAFALQGNYLTAEQFLSQIFVEQPPKAALLWITKDIEPDVQRIMGHDLGSLRVRYWRKHQRTAWILEEIGKEKLITVGLVVNNAKIEQVKVLAFRESRGWEIKHDFFTRQFQGVGLNRETAQLDTNIDGISGATLSVRAVTKLSRLALYLTTQLPTQYVASP